VWAQTKIEPEALKSKPDVPAHLWAYYRTFLTLSTRRQVGMAINPISMTDIVAYMDKFGTPEDDDEKFVAYIVLMDSAFLLVHNSRGKRGSVASDSRGETPSSSRR
jgi:hypothetical protein